MRDESRMRTFMAVLIGIVLNSMEEAREIERRQGLAERRSTGPPAPRAIPTSAHVAERIQILRAALDELERDLADPDPGGSSRSRRG